MSPLRYRLAEPAELPVLAALKSRVYRGESMEAWSRRWAWQFVHHPEKPPDLSSTFLVAEMDDRVVGGIGWIPTVLAYGGKEHASAYGCDLFIDPQAQGHGLGKALVEQVRPRFPVSQWMNVDRAGARSYEGRGFEPVAPVGYVALLLDPGKYLTARGRRGAGTLLGWTGGPARALAGLRVRGARIPPGVTVEEVREFGEDFDRLREATLEPSLVTPRRDARYLHWRYLDCPFGPYRIRAARRGGELAGYVVYRLRDRRGNPIGTVTELVAHPGFPRVGEALVAEAIRDLIRERPDFVRAFPTDPASRRIFARLGFVDARRTPHLYVSPGSLEALDLPREGTRWRMSLGDCDLDFS